MESTHEQALTPFGQGIATSPADIETYKKLLESQLLMQQNLDRGNLPNSSMAQNTLHTGVIGPGTVHYGPALRLTDLGGKQPQQYTQAEVVNKTTAMTLAMILVNDILKDHPELVDEYPEQFARLMEYI